ncbi:hypothetical protein BB561_003271 [Smittium simulii]|uniref:Homeobox domain-containing protein n=1 Tax=Smittium simulii TaxID=133385 RepID=A0A2T9YM75_9FUNG|nr:hypothetical protein BB561_003271 [Smittium simulii]
MNLAASENTLNYKTEQPEDFLLFSQIDKNNSTNLNNLVVDDALLEAFAEAKKYNNDKIESNNTLENTDLNIELKEKSISFDLETDQITSNDTFNNDSNISNLKHCRSSDDDTNELGDGYDSDKNARKRYRLTSDQTEKLNEVFEHNSKPDSNTRMELGKKLGMDPRKVQIWFQNRRAKLKRESNITNSSQNYGTASMHKLSGSDKSSLQEAYILNEHNAYNKNQNMHDLSEGCTQSISCYDLYNNKVPPDSIFMGNQQIPYNLENQPDYEKMKASFDLNGIQTPGKIKQNNLYDSANDFTSSNDIYESRKLRLQSIVSLNSYSDMGLDNRSNIDHSAGFSSHRNSISHIGPLQPLDSLSCQKFNQDFAKTDLCASLNDIVENQSNNCTSNEFIETNGMVNNIKPYFFNFIPNKENHYVSSASQLYTESLENTNNFIKENNDHCSMIEDNISINQITNKNVNCNSNSMIFNELDKNYNSKSSDNNALLDDIFVKLNDPNFFDFEKKIISNEQMSANDCSSFEFNNMNKFQFGSNNFDAGEIYKNINNFDGIDTNKNVERLAAYNNDEINDFFQISEQNNEHNFSTANQNNPCYNIENNQISNVNLQLLLQAENVKSNQVYTEKGRSNSKSSPFLKPTNGIPHINHTLDKQDNQKFIYNKQPNLNFENTAERIYENQKVLMYNDNKLVNSEDLRLNISDISIDGIIKN